MPTPKLWIAACLPLVAGAGWMQHQRAHGLESRDLTRANMVRQNWAGGRLRNVDLTEANLTGANLRRANLSLATLWHTQLRDADLSGADLSHANICGADLRGARLDGARLDYALYDNETRWPVGVRPPRAARGWQREASDQKVIHRIIPPGALRIAPPKELAEQ